MSMTLRTFVAVLLLILVGMPSVVFPGPGQAKVLLPPPKVLTGG